MSVRSLRTLPGLLAALFLAGLLIGCGSASAAGVKGKPVGGSTSTQPAAPKVDSTGTVKLVPFQDQWPSALPRLWDIGDVAYSTKYSYSYSRASVTVTYSKMSASGYLEGTVTATGLKPNFCYQLKMVGVPCGLTDSSSGLYGGLGLADNATNDWIMYNGRWWNYLTEDSSFSTNATDTTNLFAGTDKNSPARQQGWLAGYQYFLCFVTDRNGNAGPLSFTANYSYHVTRKDNQLDAGDAWGTDNNPIGPGKIAYLLDRSTSAYLRNTASGTTPVWYEGEPDNPADWKTTGVCSIAPMPAGTHRVILMVTEESFHNNLGYTSGAKGGFWDTVLVSGWSPKTSPVTGKSWVSSGGSIVEFTTP